MNRRRPVAILLAVWITLQAVAHAEESDELLSCIRNAGDVDADGTCDLMIADRSTSRNVVWIVSGKTHDVLLALHPKVETQPVVGCMDSLGDVNGDGKSDVIVCWRMNNRPFEPVTGHACVYCGLDGGFLYVFSDTWTAAAARDIDADGRPDILLGASHLWRYSKPARVEVRSGRDGSLILEKLSQVQPAFNLDGVITVPTDLFGNSLAGLGDVDGDGQGDFAVGAPGFTTFLEPSRGRVEIFSGRDGHSIATMRAGSEPIANPGWSMAALDDVDRDGVCDLLVGTLHRYATVCSGRDLRRIYSTNTRLMGAMDAFSSSLDRLGDIDGDGISEWIVGANEVPGSFDVGYAQVYSSKDGKLLRVDFESRKVGVDVCGLGDVNGDGVPDEAIACPLESWVRLLSGKDGTLIHQIDVAKLREATPKTR